jgi:hypothetical protein
MTSLHYLISQLISGWPSWGILLCDVIILIPVMYLIILNANGERRDGSGEDRITAGITYEWFLLLALLPALISTDWVVILLSAPLVGFMVFHIEGTRRYWWIAALILPVVAAGINSDDLLGRPLSGFLLHSGLMGLANMVLVLFSLVMFLNRKRKPGAS